jgi:hypothetical protein
VVTAKHHQGELIRLIAMLCQRPQPAVINSRGIIFMKTIRNHLLVSSAIIVALGFTAANAQTPAPNPATTPDSVESSIGKLQYRDGAPSNDTVAKA